MATVNFLYRSKKEKSVLIVRLLFRHNETDYAIGAKTKYEVSSQYWKKFHKQKRPRDIEIANKQVKVNTELSKIENHILDSFNSSNPKHVDKNWLIRTLDSYYNPKNKAETPLELIDYIDFYINSKRNDLSTTSIRKINVTKHKLQRFEEYRKRIILIKEVDLNFKVEFEDYCLEQLYAKNTITREIRFIKTLCNHAKYNGIETSYQLEKIQSKYIKTENIYLTLDDINKIESKHIEEPHLSNAKDWLLISCHTGQRVSDFLRFTRDMVRFENNKEGVSKPFIEFTQMKTGKDMIIPLSPKVMKILGKRNGEFPDKVSDQKYNRHIKDVCKLAELTEIVKGQKKVETKKGSKIFRKIEGEYEKWELVSSHIGRRSFATNYYGKIPTSFLINVTGHSSEKLFLSYIGKSNKDIAMELTNYF